MNAKQYDLSVDKAIAKMADQLREDMINPLSKDKDRDCDFGTYVDRYGKDSPGFITYSEF